MDLDILIPAISLRPLNNTNEEQPLLHFFIIAWTAILDGNQCRRLF